MSRQTWAITFGQQYNHEEHPASKRLGQRITGQSYMVVDGESWQEVRQETIRLVGREFAFDYPWEVFQPQITEYGLAEVCGHQHTRPASKSDQRPYCVRCLSVVGGE